MKICVVGLGYIGLPTAAMFATHGQQVVGVDKNPKVLEALSRGEIIIEEKDLTGEKLCRVVDELHETPGAVEELSKNARAMAILDTNERIYKIIKEVLGE